MVEDINLRILISVAILIAGIGLILKVLYVFYFYNVKIKKWNVVEGTISEASIEYFKSKTDSDTEGWKQKVLYTYRVNDIEYKNDMITKNIGFLAPSKSMVENNYKYLKGAKIIVHYNTNNPKESIIDDSFDYRNLLLLLIGILSFFISMFIWYS